MIATYLVLPRIRPSDQGKVVLDLEPWGAFLGSLKFQGSKQGTALFLTSLAHIGSWVDQVPMLLWYTVSYLVLQAILSPASCTLSLPPPWDKFCGA